MIILSNTHRNKNGTNPKSVSRSPAHRCMHRDFQNIAVNGARAGHSNAQANNLLTSRWCTADRNVRIFVVYIIR